MLIDQPGDLGGEFLKWSTATSGCFQRRSSFTAGLVSSMLLVGYGSVTRILLFGPLFSCLESTNCSYEAQDFSNLFRPHSYVRRCEIDLVATGGIRETAFAKIESFHSFTGRSKFEARKTICGFGLYKVGLC